MRELLSAYSGENAVNYEKIRSRSPRWKNEIEAMEDFLSKAKPTSVLDCPFGTGRWIPQYDSVGAEVIGVDLSAAMLMEAEAKLAKASNSLNERYTLIEKSIFNLTAPDLPKTPGLIACIRFLNWITFADVKRAFSILSGLGSKEMIVGASVIPMGISSAKKLQLRLALKIANLRAFGKPPQYVHEESDLSALFVQHGWVIVDQVPIFKNASRVNYFFRLSRS